MVFDGPVKKRNPKATPHTTQNMNVAPPSTPRMILVFLDINIFRDNDQIGQSRAGEKKHFGRGPFSFSFWFRTTTTNRILTFMAKRKGGLSDGWVMHSLDDHSLFFYAAGCATTKAPAPNSRDGQWHHVAAVREGDQLALYLDSEPAGTGGNRCNFADRYPIRIGMDADVYQGWHFSGDMAEVHFYNRALTAAEVAEEWNGGKPLTRAVAGGGLVAGYHLGEGNAAAEDFSGHGHAGEVVRQ